MAIGQESQVKKSLGKKGGKYQCVYGKNIEFTKSWPTKRHASLRKRVQNPRENNSQYIKGYYIETSSIHNDEDDDDDTLT